MIIIRSRRLILVLQLLCNTFCFAIGLWWGFLSLQKPPFNIGILIGFAASLYFGVTGGVLLKRLVSHHIALVLDRRGVLDNSTATPAGFVAWSEIVSTGIVTTSG